jgi:hypothetical protein
MLIQEKVDELNNNCEHKGSFGFNMWTIDDVYDAELHGLKFRKFCYLWFKTHELCNNCKYTLDNLKKLEPSIIGYNISDLYKIITELQGDINKIKYKLNIQ